jgi:hypothetical protein
LFDNHWLDPPMSKHERLLRAKRRARFVYSLKQGLIEALRGEGRPIKELWDELDSYYVCLYPDHTWRVSTEADGDAIEIDLETYRRLGITWKPVVGYEGLYEVSNTGLVHNLLTGRILRGVTLS